MNDHESGLSHERSEDVSPAAIYDRFNKLGDKMWKLWDATTTVDKDEEKLSIDEAFRLQTGEIVHFYWQESPFLDRASGELFNGMLIIGDPDSGSSPVHIFSLKIGGSNETNGAIVITDEIKDDGATIWKERREVNQEELQRLGSIFAEVEQSVDFRVAHPVESIPVQDV